MPTGAKLKVNKIISCVKFTKHQSASRRGRRSGSSISGYFVSHMHRLILPRKPEIKEEIRTFTERNNFTDREVTDPAGGLRQNSFPALQWPATHTVVTISVKVINGEALSRAGGDPANLAIRVHLHSTHADSRTLLQRVKAVAEL